MEHLGRFLASGIAAAVSLALVACSPAGTSQSCTVSDKLVPSCGVWLGVDPGARSDTPVGKALRAVESGLGDPMDILHVYKVDDTVFPDEVEHRLTSDPDKPRYLFVNWKPTFGRTWAQVAQGDRDVDRLITRMARETRSRHPQPFFLALWHEPENDVIPEAGSGYTADDYRAMYRHVVEVLREAGLDNAVFVMNYMGSPKWTPQPWFPDLYPGDDVVDWVAFDPYVYADPGYKHQYFAEMLNRHADDDYPGFYDWVVDAHPDKPVMLAEFGVGDSEENRDFKPEFFSRLPDELADFPALKALVYFDSSDSSVGDARIESSDAAQRAFAEMAEHEVFAMTPEVRP